MSDGAVDFSDLTKRMDGAISSLKNDLAGLRTGRASASLLDPVMVDAYGQKMPISQVGTVNVPEARMVSVQVWDKTMVAAVEKGIRDAGLGLNPVVDGQNLRIPLPELNEERRKELVKIAHSYAENAKVAIRHVRRDGMEEIKKAEKDSDIGKDDARTMSERVQKMTDDMVTSVDSVVAVKETEILQV